MSAWPALAAALFVAGLIGLYANGRAFSRKVEKAFPPLGRFVPVGRTRLHLIERGDPNGPPVLFLHGAVANARDFLKVASWLEDDHRLLMLDRPGYGYSGRARRNSRLGTQANLCADLLEKEGAGGAILVGHSLGAAVALRLAAERPDLVRGLVLIAPASHPVPRRNVWWTKLTATPLIGPIFAGTLVPIIAHRSARGAVKRIFRPADPPRDYLEDAAVPLGFRRAAFRASANDVIAAKREFPILHPLYERIEAPAIVLAADEDHVLPPEVHARGLARDLVSVELVTLPGAGHMPHQLRPEAVAAAIRRVLEISAARGVAG